jgi:hypothetical protein
MSVTAIDLAISTFCALGFFFSLLRQRTPEYHTPVIVNVFASLGAFALTFLTIYAISWALHI